MLDSYTIRKAMPRILLAVIGINVSIYLCVAMIDLTTIVSKGLSGLLMTPFAGSVPVEGTQIEVNAENTIVGSGALLVIVGGIIAVVANPLGALGFLLPVIITVALISLAVLFTLVIRQALVLFLTILSPVAIALSILPRTEKYFQQWFDLFTRTLMVYPIIAGLFVMSNVMGVILLGSASGNVASTPSLFNPASMFNNPIFAQSSDGDGTAMIKYLAAIVAIYAPLILIPFAFKLAGGAIAAISNAAGGAVRKGNLGGRAGAAFSKSRQDPTSFLGKRETAAQSRRLRRGWTAGQVLAGSGALIKGQGREGYRTASRTRADLKSRVNARNAMQNNATLQQLAFDDNGIAVLALSGGTRAGAERAATDLGLEGDARNRALSSASAVGFNGANTMGAIDLMAQNKARALNGVNGGQRGMDLVRQSATALSGGNRQLEENIMGGFAYNARGGGRFDLGGEMGEKSLAGGWERTAIPQVLQGYGESTEQFANEFSKDIKTGSDSARRNAALALSGLHGGLPGATEGNARIVNDTMRSIGVRHDATRIKSDYERDPDGKVLYSNLDDRGQRTATSEPIRKDVSVAVSVEEQLANIANGRDATDMEGPNSVISVEDLIGESRKYGNQPLGARQGEDPAATTPPPDLTAPPS